MILGAVIAGGRSRRFGSDKALAPVGGRPMIDHAIRALARHADAVVVCGRGHGKLVALADRPGPDLGPLGGINAALHHAAGAGFGTVLTLPCDTPAIASGVLADLVSRNGAVVLAACPIIGCWPVALAAQLDLFLADGADRSIRAWARYADAVELDRPAPINVNAPEDLARLDRVSA